MRYHTQTGSLICASGEMARAMGHSYVGSIHILLALLEQPGETGLILRGMGLEPEPMENMVKLLYGAGTPICPCHRALPRGHAGSSAAPPVRPGNK